MTENTDKKSDKFVIVQATDLLPDADATMAHGLAIARRTGGQLITLHVNDKPADEPLSDPEKMLIELAKKELEIDHHTVVCRIDEKPTKGLLKSIEGNKTDLLIMGTRQQRGDSKNSRKSVTETAALDASMPTLVVHVGQRGLVNDEGAIELDHVLLPVGDGEEARDAIRGLTKLLDRLQIDDIDITLLRIGDDEILEYLTIPERDGWRWHRETRKGFVSNTIAEICEAKDIDLITMSTRGQDGIIDVFSGTHTQKVIRRAPCPLLVIPMT